MIQVTVIKPGGTRVLLNGASGYTLVEVKGVNPPKAGINTEGYATADGSVFNSSRLNNRNVVLTFYASSAAAEAGRIDLYQLFRSKKPVELEFKTKNRTVTAAGWVESVEVNLFTNPQKIAVSVICPDPFLKAAQSSQTFGGTVNNGGEMETGGLIEITASGAAENITLANTTTGEECTIAATLASGDKITLNTRQGQKGVKLTSSGADANILNDFEGDWLTFEPGANTTTITAESGAANLSAIVKIIPLFEGV